VARLVEGQCCRRRIEIQANLGFAWDQCDPALGPGVQCDVSNPNGDFTGRQAAVESDAKTPLVVASRLELGQGRVRAVFRLTTTGPGAVRRIRRRQSDRGIGKRLAQVVGNDATQFQLLSNALDV
jgi:hypothetical protein